jgi:hypothetical protein
MNEDSHLEMAYEDRHSTHDYLDDVDAWNEADDDRFWDDDDGLSDVEADAMTLASVGMGTDEDYGYYGEEY